MKPVVGVTLSATGSRLIWYMHKLAILRAGGRAKKITAKTGLKDDVDAYVIGGGDDIGLEINGNEIDPSIRYDHERDALELEVLKHAYQTNKPVLGICRGAQMINLSRGGTLYFDLSRIDADFKGRRMLLPRTIVNIAEHSLLFGLLKKRTITVNALHHQSINKVGEDLKTVAHDADGIVQAIECKKSGNLMGVQWHPELIPWSRNQGKLFRWLVERAGAA